MEFENGSYLRSKKESESVIRPITPFGTPAQKTGVSALPSATQSVQSSQPIPFAAPKVNSGNPDPRDAQYFTDVTKLDNYFKARTADIAAATAQANAGAGLSLESLGQSRTEAKQSFDRGIRDIGISRENLAHQKPIDIRNQTNASNKAGLLYSGFQNDALGNIGFEYGQREKGLANNEADLGQQLGNQNVRFGLQEKGIKQDLAAALAGYQRQSAELAGSYGPSGTDRQSLLQDAISRQLQRDAVAAQNGAGTTAAPAPANFRSIPYTSPSGAKGVLHIYPDGRRVFVKK